MKRIQLGLHRAGRLAVATVLALVLGCAQQAVQATTLADQPVFATSDVPGNLVLALSVEFPTAVTAADRSAYSNVKKYVGYFDPLRCYTYQYNDTTLDHNGVAYGNYFYPDGSALASISDSCAGKWSGNFMNWATMQAVDPFRWALTGGYRAVDDVGVTILEKAFAPSNQGSTSNNFPNQAVTSNVNTLTPFSGNFYMHVLRCGTKMLFNRGSALSLSGDTCPTTGVTAWNGNIATTDATSTYSVDVRVKVCTSTAVKEVNCVQYGGNYKPEGLMQKYADKIRYSAFGYLNDPAPTGGSMNRDGGVMRARMKFVGPTQPVPGSVAITNTQAEWSATTGQFVQNPDPADATASSETGSVVVNSGVVNYLNQFGRSAQAYKYYDPVSELYYAATRYLRNKGDVPAFSDLSTFNGGSSTLANRTAMKDGFPVIRNWDDPIKYSCQKNFVLGIGDTNTNQDKTVPGNSTWRTNEPASIPSEVSNDNIDVVAATNKVGVLEGDMGATIGNTNQYNTSNNSAYIAGMAYLFNTTNIRPDLGGNQNIATYWLDVLEGNDSSNSGYKAGSSGRNQFYLAAKYGGFKVPAGYSYATNTTKLPQNLWATTADTLPVSMNGLNARPDNFYVADQAAKLVTGLTNAFASIASAIKAYTTSFSLSTAQVSSTGSASYASQYDSSGWTGVVTASQITFATDGTPSATAKWSSSSTLQTQLAGTGWNTGRNVATWNGSAGVAFRAGNLTSAQQTALTPGYATSNTYTDYVNYLRGDTTNETGSATSSSTKAFRSRVLLLGDIVDAKLTPVGPPAQPYSESSNPGYAAFKTRWTTTTPRPTMVYAGANDGMLHAFNGALTGTGAGAEQFAYVPSALYQGPNGTPQTDGLVQLGNPNYVHHFYVDATPVAYDIDFNSATSAAASDWHTLLVGGLGKGGKSYYAIDVTDPASMSTEAVVAGKVKWEFIDSTMGYSYGTPIVVKTKKYGWVVVLTSGYNNSDGKGYLYFVNPKDGTLLEKVGTATSSNGLTQASAYVNDYTDNTADAIYVGDLGGQLWRFDLTEAKGNAAAYPAPTLLATLADASGNAQPITSAPLIEIHPLTRKRFVLVGTGQLLASSDVSSTAAQSFYAIIDGTAGGFSSVSAAITRADLVQLTNVLTGVNLPNTAKGWYMDVGVDSTSSIGWRLVSSPSAYNGVVTFATLLTSGDACSPSGQSRVYALNYGTGKSVLSSTGTAYIGFTSAVTDLRIVSVDGTPEIIAGTTKGDIKNPAADLKSAVVLRLLNWRELSTVD